MHYGGFLAALLAVGADKTSAMTNLTADSIRRLAPSTFRQLGTNVRRDLERRGCLVPQVWDRKVPHNVIQGAFTSAHASEWAVLCSVREHSQILIYQIDPAGAAQVVDSLKRSSDAAWVQSVGEGRWGYSRFIQALPRQQIRAWRVDIDRNKIPQPIDHDAIEDVFLEKAGQAFYFARGRWYRQLTTD